jgi:mxaJ protein
MKKLAALALVLLAGSCSENERVLRVCADPNNLPFSNRAGQGFENRIVELAAAELGARIDYTWWAQRRGNVRETLNAGLCDLIPGVGAGIEMLATTEPYYNSTYVAVTRADFGPGIASFDDPRLRDMRIGVQMIGDDFSNTPPAHALASRGLIDNIRGYMVYGDYARPAPQREIVDAVARGEIDVAFVWGPVAGWLVQSLNVPLQLTPLPARDEHAGMPMVFAIAMGLRRGDAELGADLDRVVAERRLEIARILADYGVPTVPRAPAAPDDD